MSVNKFYTFDLELKLKFSWLSVLFVYRSNIIAFTLNLPQSVAKYTRWANGHVSKIIVFYWVISLSCVEFFWHLRWLSLQVCGDYPHFFRTFDVCWVCSFKALLCVFKAVSLLSRSFRGVWVLFQMFQSKYQCSRVCLMDSSSFSWSLTAIIANKVIKKVITVITFMKITVKYKRINLEILFSSTRLKKVLLNECYLPGGYHHFV